ncbi:pyridoxal phosphate-dependent decarboxylase family protein [Leptothoe spongobia]|uniref:Aspartate aminotransferase family protein n=1 Tax=Leptothoe spongobia TAU-MAC 1115 TaxID=1967444 RepID=A0A947DF94_9CYAN|nr:aminotransferase class I/II-fold pyridoxal phosphate-dependent enzyme [Leptothoe spongobia]MBT9315690.1 aspartate aminotransferase family protein [Leptothoe spongobia TAU-MAC 1115]
MDFSALPTTAFIHPDGKNRDAIATLLHQVIDLLVETMTQATNRSPLPEPLVLKDRIRNLPQKSIDLEQLLEETHAQIIHSMNAAHPGYIGHMDSIPTTLSVLSDLLVAALNNNMLSVEMSPVFSRLETLVLQQIAQLFGLGAQANGVLVSGGSLANLQALIVARNIAFDSLENGIMHGQKPVFLVSEVAHTSFQKAAMVMGLGTKAAIPVKTNSNSQIDIDDLQVKLAQAKAAGQHPFAIVATAGTTVTGSIDPIVAMYNIAKTHQLWFHVDAAYGGAIILSERYRHQLSGIELADSVTFNPQKWLYVAKTCAIVMFRNFDLLQHHFRVLAPYMHDHDGWPNLGEFTVQGTRHPDILKLWLSLQHIGRDGYSAIIDHNYALTTTFTNAVKARSFLALASEPQMNLVCFRAQPTALPLDQWDSWNHGLQTWLLEKGNTFLSLPIYRGQRWLKAVLLNPFTTTDHIHRVFEHIDSYYTSHQG